MTFLLKNPLASLLALLLILTLIGWALTGIELHFARAHLLTAQESNAVCLSSNAEFHVALDRQNEAVAALRKAATQHSAAQRLKADRLRRLGQKKLREAAALAQTREMPGDRCQAADRMINAYLEERQLP